MTVYLKGNTGFVKMDRKSSEFVSFLLVTVWLWCGFGKNRFFVLRPDQSQRSRKILIFMPIIDILEQINVFEARKEKTYLRRD